MGNVFQILTFFFFGATLCSPGYSETLNQRVEQARAERQAIAEQLDQLSRQLTTGAASSGPKFGGYGEIHYNGSDKPGNDFIDIHRLVIFMGYEFNDWIELNSELELEHAFVGPSEGGEYKVEQLSVDFSIMPELNLRLGRMLAPLGLINENHEPTLFNGVERPSFSKYIIPSTWALDGVGLYGAAGALSYKLYLTSFLDGSAINEKNGIRSARMHERPGMSQKAVSLRLSYNVAEGVSIGYGQISGGLNNGDKGVNPGIDRSVKLRLDEVDIKVDRRPFHIKAVAAQSRIEQVKRLNQWHQDQCEAGSDCSAPNIAEVMGGYFVELGLDVLPNRYKKAKLIDAELRAFVRFDSYDTQMRMTEGSEANRAANRDDLTYGLSFLPMPQVIIKVDRQVTRDEKGNKINKTNAGIGWVF